MQTSFTEKQLENKENKTSETILRKCVHCGMCNATCPTYGINGDELEGPRGRIYLIKDMLENNKEITIVDDQFRMPTYVEDLAMVCKLSIDKNTKGIYHVSSNELLSVFEIANQIATVFGLNKKLIKPISSETLNQKAIRPPNTGFNLFKIRRDLEFQPTSFLEGLKRFKQTLI